MHHLSVYTGRRGGCQVNTCFFPSVLENVLYLIVVCLLYVVCIVFFYVLLSRGQFRFYYLIC